MAFKDSLSKPKTNQTLTPKRRVEVFQKNKPNTEVKVPKKLWYDEEFQPIIFPGEKSPHGHQTHLIEKKQDNNNTIQNDDNKQNKIIKTNTIQTVHGTYNSSIPNNTDSSNLNEFNFQVSAHSEDLIIASTVTNNTNLEPCSTNQNLNNSDLTNIFENEKECENKFDISLYNSLLHKIEALCNFLGWDKHEKNELINAAQNNTKDCSSLIDELFERYINPENQKKQNLLLSYIEKEPQKCFLKIKLPQAEAIFEIKTTDSNLFYLFNGSNFIFHPLQDTPFDI